MKNNTNLSAFGIKRNRSATFGIAAAWFIVGALLIYLIIVADFYPESLAVKILAYVFLGLIAAIPITLGLLNVRNLFYPYIIMVDKSGIYDYSGFNHLGLIKWGDVGDIAYSTGQSLIDLLFDNQLSGIRIYPKNFNEYKKNLNFFKRLGLLLSNSNVKICTFLSFGKAKDIAHKLCDWQHYYDSGINF